MCALRDLKKGPPRVVSGGRHVRAAYAFLETRWYISELLYHKWYILVPINRSHGVHQDGPGPIQFHECGAEP